jgi:hypothetical protein
MGFVNPFYVRMWYNYTEYNLVLEYWFTTTGTILRRNSGGVLCGVSVCLAKSQTQNGGPWQEDILYCTSTIRYK